MSSRYRTKKIRKWPNKYQWLQFFSTLTKKERITFLIFLVLFLGSSFFLLSSFYTKNTQVVPAKGGTHIEGVVGQPRFINPIYANSDVDRDLSQLIFSGLMKYDENMNIVPDLAEKYEIEENGQVYRFYLKEKLFWHDKTPLSSNDIIFTIETIQNPDYKSPLRANWVGVEVEKIDDRTVKFTLKKPYSAFLENCTIKILPQHIWKNVSPENFPFNSHNLNPIGSGPYKIKEIKQGKIQNIEDLSLVRNSLYFAKSSTFQQGAGKVLDKKPNISEIKFLFFNTQKDLIKAAQRNRINGLSLNIPLEMGKNWQSYYFSMPRYFGIFFNPKESEVLAQKEVRIALNHGANKKEIIKKALNLEENSPFLERAVVHSPILPKVYGFDPLENIYEFDIEKAKEILDKIGFKETEKGIREKTITKKPAFEFTRRLEKGSKGNEVTELQKCLAKFPDIYPQGQATGYFGNKTKQAVINFQEKYSQDILAPWGFTSGTGIVSKTTRSKLNEICFEAPDKILSLEFSLVTVNQAQLVAVAEELKKQWQALGVEIEIQKISVFQLEQDFIKPRKYQALLFGEVLGAIPDLLPFWHSSQKKDPGLNLALYENNKVDELLEEIRQSSDPEFRAEKLNLVQELIVKDVPAVFLYCPDYIYLVSKKIQGITTQKIVDPSKRFVGIEDWYIKTKRVWK